MPFQKGVRLPNQGGYRPNGGRKSLAELARIELENQAFIREALKDGAKKGKHYSEQVYKETAVLLDYRKWVTGEAEKTPPSTPVAVNIIHEGGTTNIGIAGTRNGVGIHIGSD